MTTHCPCCGSSVERPVIVSLDTNTVATAMGFANLQPRQAEVMSVLANSFPEAAEREFLGRAVFGKDWLDGSRGLLDVQVCLARKAIKPLGLRIENVYGTGYRLSANKTEGA